MLEARGGREFLILEVSLDVLDARLVSANRAEAYGLSEFLLGLSDGLQ